MTVATWKKQPEEMLMLIDDSYLFSPFLFKTATSLLFSISLVILQNSLKHTI